MTVQLVVGAVIVDDVARPARVLAARRSGTLAGYWEFPGGKVEPDEQPRSALVREIREELGTEVEVVDQIGEDGADWPISETLKLRLYGCRIVGSDPAAGTSHDLLAWLSAADLDAHDWLESDRAALPTVRQWLGW